MNKEKDQNSYHKINLNWYPGHMAKTMKQLETDLKLVDVVVEILDARIPVSSQNPEVQKLIKNKKKIVVLNKSDLANEIENKKWLKYFEEKQIPAILCNSNNGEGVNKIINKLNEIMSEERNIAQQKGRNKIVRAMIIGIPNVGKSSFINRVSKKTSMRVGNKPGVTKNKQWIRLTSNVELLDTPGVLWPKFESQEVALNLAFTGTIKEDILQRTEIAYELIKFLLKNYKKKICQRYGITEEYIDNTLNKEQPENFNIYEIMLEIGRKRGCIISGGNIDEEKTARIILDEFKNGKLGKITLESPKK